ncbi:MAG: hypothetical protein JXB23_05890, partial [Candidatus Aminicenantes bacterium]|nr:hypothetical protein [Candidatus Aminicenantes bacterium]
MKALNLRYLISAVVLAVSLYFFYLKYVPLVAPFQWIFFPILILLFVLTCFRLRWGILLFVFLFPLINNLPYFFGIYQNIPHAPTALTLFLFFFLGWLFHRSFSLSDSAARTTLFKPLGFFTLLILVSGVITLFRYANFYPFLTSRVYELVTNVDGVSSGGAMMSTLFFTLNYLTGFALFMLLVRTVKSQKVLQEVLLVLGISTLLALGFGLFQHLFAHSLGNTLR